MGLPLLRRAALHALKSLVRNNPGAAFGAARTGIVYAAKDVAQQGTDKAREIWNGLAEPQGEQPSPVIPPNDIEKLAEELDEEEREALAEFVRKHPSDSRSG